MTYRMTIDYNDEILLSVAMRREEFEREARFLLAAKLYELGKLSSGQAATMCGMQRVEFLSSLSRVGVAMSNLGEEDAADELRFGLQK